MTLQEQRDIIQSAIDGKDVQERRKTGFTWTPVASYRRCIFDFVNFAYRIRQEPREFYINSYRGGREMFAHNSRDDAARFAMSDPSETIRVREIIED